MKKQLLILYLTLGITNLFYGQEYPEKDKKYDSQIFEFLDSITDKEPISIDRFLVYSKPFSKWDSRPLDKKKVWALDGVYRASEVPNFFWGAFANKYKISEKEASQFPNQFLGKGIDDKESLKNSLLEKLKKFNQLSKLIAKSPSKIYLSQEHLKRVDNLYKENNNYWTYIIPLNSPFPISNKVESSNLTFSLNQIEILDLLKSLNIYAAIRTQEGIFYLVDGFTDNSYGFYYHRKGKMETDNPLFQIMKVENINENYFYYVAN